MEYIITKNNKPVKLKEIPRLDMRSFREQTAKMTRDGMRPVLYFGLKQGKSVFLYSVLADDDDSRLYIYSGDLEGKTSYPSITTEIPSFWNFENEIHEEFGIVPEGHPWLRPVRYAFDRHDRSKTMERFPFFKMSGDEMHEVAVGPIHAGVIEPGTFPLHVPGRKSASS